MNIPESEIRTMMQDVAQNAANISAIMNAIEDQKKDTAKILSYLDNDPSTGRIGIFAKQMEHEQRIDMIELERSQEKTKQKVYIGVATFVGGLIMSIATFGFKLLFGK